MRSPVINNQELEQVRMGKQVVFLQVRGGWSHKTQNQNHLLKTVQRIWELDNKAKMIIKPSFEVCHTEFDTVADVEAVEECELVTRRHCTELHQQVVSSLPRHEVTIPEPIFRSTEAMQQPYVQDIFSAVPKCHDNQVIAS